MRIQSGYFLGFYFSAKRFIFTMGSSSSKEVDNVKDTGIGEEQLRGQSMEHLCFIFIMYFVAVFIHLSV